MIHLPTWALILVVTLANGEETQTVLADPPFTTISACAIAAGMFYRRGVSVPADMKEARMDCVPRWRFRL